MSVPSANTRASRNVRRTASQPLIEKPASRWTGCAGVETALPIAPMTMLKSCSASSDQAIVCKRDALAATNGDALSNGPNDREQPFEDDVVQGDCGEAERGDCAQTHDEPVCVWRRESLNAAMIHCWLGMTTSRARIAAPPSQFRTMRIRNTTCAIGSAASQFVH